LKLQIILKIFSFSKESNIPSQPIKIKSLFLLSLKNVIEGFAIKTEGFPPKILTLDSASPKALET
jgi:hypothetical protein